MQSRVEKVLFVERLLHRAKMFDEFITLSCFSCFIMPLWNKIQVPVAATCHADWWGDLLKTEPCFSASVILAFSVIMPGFDPRWKQSNRHHCRMLWAFFIEPDYVVTWRCWKRAQSLDYHRQAAIFGWRYCVVVYVALRYNILKVFKSTMLVMQCAYTVRMSYMANKWLNTFGIFPLRGENEIFIYLSAERRDKWTLL